MIESWRTMLIARYDLIRNVNQGVVNRPSNHNDTDAYILALRRDLVFNSRVNLQLHLEGNWTFNQASSDANMDQTSNTFYAGLDLMF